MNPVVLILMLISMLNLMLIMLEHEYALDIELFFEE